MTASRADVVSRHPQACSGLLTGLILAYVERAAGAPGVEQMLDQTGLRGCEAALRDEDSWFAFETKIRLWDAAADVTGDRDVALHAGEAGLELTVGLRLKQAMRALGTPDVLFRNIARVSNKFNTGHSLELIEREPGRVRLVYRDVAGLGYHRYDCQCTTGLLRMVPPLFGLPQARVSHPVCGARGAEQCEFDVTWTAGRQSLRRVAIPGAALATGLAGAGAVAGPALIGAGAVAAVATACLTAVRAVAVARRRIRALEVQVRELGEESELQLQALASLSCELRLDKALERIAETARTTIGGAHFALLVAEADEMRPEADSGIPAGSVARLARWAHAHQQQLRRGPIVFDDLAAADELAAVSVDRELPLQSACAVPLIYGDRLLGVLVALAPAATVLFPKDVRSLELYAGHAAIALWNARLVEQLELHAAEDSLTGLANRRAFDGACAAELDRLARHGGTLALVVFDLDHFKQINDSYGHPFGDRILIAVAALLRTVLRAHDTVARLGGEEFGLLLPGATLDEAHEIAERARELLGTVALPHGTLSCSAGVAVAGRPETSAAELFEEADRALYEAKRQGRGRTAIGLGAGVGPA